MSIFYLMPLRVQEPEATYSQFQGDCQQQKGHNWYVFLWLESQKVYLMPLNCWSIHYTLYSHQDSGSPLTKNLLINAHRPSFTAPSLKLSTILYYLLQVPVFKKQQLGGQLALPPIPDVACVWSSLLLLLNILVAILVTLLLVNVHRRNMRFDLRGLFCHVLYVINP